MVKAFRARSSARSFVAGLTPAAGSSERGMRTPQEQEHTIKDDMAALLSGQATGLARSWLESDAGMRLQAGGHAAHEAPVQAAILLRLLADALRSPADDIAGRDLPAVEAALRATFPAVYRMPALLALAELLTRHLHAPLEAVVATLHDALSRIALKTDPGRFFNERLGRLNQLSWQLNAQTDEDAIIALTLVEAPALVGAASCAIWLWDADQQVPVVMITLQDQTAVADPPPALHNLFRQTCDSCCAFSIDAGESEASWPAELQGRPVAFLPLPGQEGCLGIVTVHHVANGSFSHDDILLLSSLANLAATALRNIQLHASQRHLVSLLQTSIRQVGEATANRTIQYDELMSSLLHVAEGLTRADAVAAALSLDGTESPVTAVTGPMASSARDVLPALGQRLLAAFAGEPLPAGGIVRDFWSDGRAAMLPPWFAAAEICLGGERMGIVVAVAALPFADDQAAFLGTIANQIGVGVESRQQAASLQRLLIDFSNINYVSQEITSTFDPHKIFQLISQAASQALRAPIALCGWLEDSGTIRVLPDTTVGIPPELSARLSFTYNNAVVRQVLDQRVEVSSRTMGKRALTAFPSLRRLHVRDWVCVPMMIKPRARGIMLVADVERRDFSAREVALLSTYANQAALAMENSLLYEQVEQQLQQMEALYQLTRSIGATLDLETILLQLLHHATAALQLPAAVVSLLDDDGGSQRVAAIQGIDPDSLPGTRIEAGEGIFGTVCQRGEAIVSSNLLRDGRSALLRDLARLEHLSSSLTVPLQVQSTVLGTVTVISREAREYTPANMQLLQAMATEAAVAMQNARLYEAERERSRELRRLVTEAMHRLGTALDLLDEMLRIAGDTEAMPEGIARTRLRLESFQAIQAVLDENADTDSVDVKAAVTWLASARAARYARDGQSIDLRVLGAHFALSSRLATALVLLVHEWMQAAVEASLVQGQKQVTVTFQQFGRDILVHVEDAAAWSEASAPVNHAIIAMTTRILPGTLAESQERDMHRFRFRFTRPA